MAIAIAFLGIEIFFITPASLFAGIVVGVLLCLIDHKVLEIRKQPPIEIKNVYADNI